MSTLNEPEPGWLENFNGPSGVIAAGGSSIVRGIYCNYDSTPQVAPVDLCANLMLSIAWYIANYR
jgi:fatty acyl-CoA reductase